MSRPRAAWFGHPGARARAALRASQERTAFLVQFSDTVRGVADPQAVTETACRMIAERLGVDRAHWAVVDWATREFVVDAEFRVFHLPPTAGRFPVEEGLGLERGRGLAEDRW